MNPSCSSLILCLVFPVAFHALSQIASKEKISQMKYFVSYRRYAFTCYGQFPPMCLDKMRVRMSPRKILRKGHVPLKLCNLPPTSNAFKIHCHRAHFQTSLWKMAGNTVPPDLTPCNADAWGQEMYWKSSNYQKDKASLYRQYAT